jgi:hypothetical protein
MTTSDSRRHSRSRAARSRERLRSRPLRMSSMNSLAIVRALVQRLMQADADDEDRRKSKLNIRKGKFLRIRNYPDEDDDDPD